MDENNNEAAHEDVKSVENKKLSMLAKTIFFISAPVIALVYAAGTLGVLGLPLVIAAAAMNVILALEFEKSVPKLLSLLFINLVPFAVIGALYLSVPAALWALFPLALALPIWITVKAGLGRGASVALASTFAAALFFGSFAIGIIAQYGALNAETFGAVLDTLFEPTRKAMEEFAAENAELLVGVDIDSIIYYVKSMFIGSVGALMVVLAYLTTLAVRLIAHLFGTSWRLPSSVRVYIKASVTEEGPKFEVSHEEVLWRVDIDSVTVGVYIASFAALLIFGALGTEIAEIVCTVALNLFIILSPAFIYCALRDVFLRLRPRFGKSSKFTLIVLGVLLIVNPATMMFFLCFIGAIAVMRENRAKRGAEKLRKDDANEK